MEKQRWLKKLIDGKADVNLQNEFGTSALMAASWKGNAKMIEMLIDAKADINMTNNYWSTSLTKAILYGTTEVVSRLLEANADVTTINITDTLEKLWINGDREKCVKIYALIERERVRRLISIFPDLGLPRDVINYVVRPFLTETHTEKNHFCCCETEPFL